MIETNNDETADSYQQLKDQKTIEKLQINNLSNIDSVTQQIDNSTNYNQCIQLKTFDDSAGYIGLESNHDDICFPPSGINSKSISVISQHNVELQNPFKITKAPVNIHHLYFQ